MQQFCQYGSVRGATGNRRPYRDVRQHKLASGSWCKSNTRKKWRITLAPSHAYSHREVRCEALTGETGRPAIEPRNNNSGTLTLFKQAESEMRHDDNRKP